MPLHTPIACVGVIDLARTETGCGGSRDTDEKKRNQE